MNGIRYTPLINGVTHSWANLLVAIAGIPITGINKITYKDTQKMENIYGAGQKPVGRGYGKIEFTGTISLLRSEIETLRESCSTKRLQDIAPFDVIVQFLPVNGQKVMTHILKNVQIQNDDVEVSEGDVSNFTILNLVIGDIEKR